MKALTFFLLITCRTLSAYCQQQLFTSVSIENIRGRKTVLFTLPREINVRHYRVEAGNDSVRFDVIATIRPYGNGQLARSYQYDLTAFSYKYYRVGIVAMGPSLPYSPVVHFNNTIQGATPAISPAPTQLSPGALVHQ